MAWITASGLVLSRLCLPGLRPRSSARSLHASQRQQQQVRPGLPRLHRLHAVPGMLKTLNHDSHLSEAGSRPLAASFAADMWQTQHNR